MALLVSAAVATKELVSQIIETSEEELITLDVVPVQRYAGVTWVFTEAVRITPGRVMTAANVNAGWVRCPFFDVSVGNANLHTTMQS